MKKKINWKNYFSRHKNKKSPLDINILFPGYFYKNVFRGVVVLMILFTIFVYMSNGGLKFNYVECPASTETFCEYYQMNYTGDAWEQKPIIMQPGEYIDLGRVPNYWAKNYNKICLLMVLVGFIINHLVYFIKERKFIPPLNKEKWNKIKENFKEAVNNEN